MQVPGTSNTYIYIWYYYNNIYLRRQRRHTASPPASYLYIYYYFFRGQEAPLYGLSKKRSRLFGCTSFFRFFFFFVLFSPFDVLLFPYPVVFIVRGRYNVFVYTTAVYYITPPLPAAYIHLGFYWKKRCIFRFIHKRRANRKKEIKKHHSHRVLCTVQSPHRIGSLVRGIRTVKHNGDYYENARTLPPALAGCPQPRLYLRVLSCISSTVSGNWFRCRGRALAESALRVYFV